MDKINNVYEHVTEKNLRNSW